MTDKKDQSFNNDTDSDFDSKDYKNDIVKLKNLKEQIYSEENFKRQVASKIKTVTPYKRPVKDKSRIEQAFRQLKEKAQNQIILKPNYITTERHSSLTDLTLLKRISLKEMIVNKIHIGFYLECKTIADPFYTSGMHLLVSDSNDDIENVLIYTFESNSYDIDPKMLIPVGTNLIIKEPHLQMFGLDENNFGIRIDSPSDLLIVSYKEAENNKTSEEFIEEGNRSFSKCHFHVAVRFYTLAIEKSNQTNIRPYLNRSQAYIKLEKYSSAYLDAKKVVSLDNNNEKAYFRMGKSAYMMRKFELALENFDTCIRINPKNAEAEFEIKKTKDRINESKTGLYNFHALYEQFFKRDNLYMDIADYKSDKIQVVDIKNKSKGVIATDFIKKGTLLVVCKAVSAIFHNKIDYRKKSQNTVYFSKNSYTTKSETENIANIVYKMQDDPDLASKVYSLYAGPEYGRDKLAHPLIDIKRIEAIYSFNSFQIKNAYETLEIMELENQTKSLKNYNEDDFNELDLTSVSFESDSFKKLANLQVKFNNLNKQCGLWYYSAFFNHSCISNVTLNTIGDVMVFYAQKDIQKNEELTIRYFPPEWSYTDKVERAMQIYGFKCDCLLCKLDEKDALRTAREKLIDQIETKNNSMNGQRVSISEASLDVNKMRQTYLNRSEYQFFLITPLEILASKYRENYDYKKSAKCYNEIFELMKDYNDFVAVNMLKEQLSDYKKCAQSKKLEACKKAAFLYFESLHLNKFYYEKLFEKIFQNLI